jgi:hypothetical protein
MTTTNATPLDLEQVRARLVRVYRNALRRPRTLEQARAFISNGAKPKLTAEQDAPARALADGAVSFTIATATRAPCQTQGPLQGLVVVLHTPAKANHAPGDAQDRLQPLLQELWRGARHLGSCPPPGSNLADLLAWHRACPYRVEPSGEAGAVFDARLDALADPVLAVREGREAEWMARQADPEWVDRLRAEVFGEGSS